MTMTKRERLVAAMTGKEVDEVPIALWRHFPGDDQDVEQLALSAVEFQQRYDWTFIKLTPSSHYSVADWGTRVEYRGSLHGTSDYVHYPIKSADALKNLRPLDPRTGAMGQQLHCVRRVRELAGADVPIIETVFSPLDQVRHLVGSSNELIYVQDHLTTLRDAMELITETTIAFVKAVIEAGADGIFYATQYARSTKFTRDEYRTLFRPLDIRILEAAQAGWFNMLHLHGNDTFFDVFVDYPVQAINWHDRDTGPSLAEGAKHFPGLVVGGVSQNDIVRKTPAEIQQLGQKAITETGGRRMCLSTGCVLPIVAPWGNIRAFRSVV